MLNEQWIWKIRQTENIEESLDKEATPSEKKALAAISPVIRKLLAGRGIVRPDDIERFLNPDMTDLHEPMLLPDMKKSVERLKQAILKGERIWIYGDYDVDGITSITILMKYFEAVGVPASYYIPDRMDEGYGLNAEAIEHIASKGCDVLVSVDCGITAVKEAVVAKACGIDLIITDHHECPEQLPEAFALINPKRPASLYPYEMLAGAGVAYKLTTALTAALGEKELALKEGLKNGAEVHDELLALAAIGTIADIAPLTDENRILAKFGLEHINQAPFLGLKHLIEQCGLAGKKISAGHIGYFLAPKINAAGRIGDPALGVRLLMSKSPTEATEIAARLVALNEERQMKEREVLECCLAQVEQEKLYRNPIIIVYGNDFHSGIIGIVASRIVERYHRPAVVLSLDTETSKAKGSARSVEGISIYEALGSAQHLYEKFGGHDMAAGLSFKAEHLEAFKEQMQIYGAAHITDDDLLPILRLEDELGPKDIDYRLMDQLEHLEPFGAANPKPVFSLKGLSVENYRRMGKNEEHVKLSVSDGDRIYDAVAFNVSEGYGGISQNERLDLAFTLEKNSFKGIESIQMMIKDLRRSHVKAEDAWRFEFAMAEAWFENALYLTNQDEAFDKQPDVLSCESLMQILKEERVLLVCNSQSWVKRLRHMFYDHYYREMGFVLPGSGATDRSLGDALKRGRRLVVSAGVTYEAIASASREGAKGWDAVIVFSEKLNLPLEACAALSRAAGTKKMFACNLSSDEVENFAHTARNMEHAVPDRDLLARVYKHLKKEEGTVLSGEQTARSLAVSPFTLGVSLSLMRHLGMLDYRLGRAQEGVSDNAVKWDDLHFTMMPVTGKLNLQETAAYQSMLAYKKTGC